MFIILPFAFTLKSSTLGVTTLILNYYLIITYRIWGEIRKKSQPCDLSAYGYRWILEHKIEDKPMDAGEFQFHGLFSSRHLGNPTVPFCLEKIYSLFKKHNLQILGVKKNKRMKMHPVVLFTFKQCYTQGNILGHCMNLWLLRWQITTCLVATNSTYLFSFSFRGWSLQSASLGSVCCCGSVPFRKLKGRIHYPVFSGFRSCQHPLAHGLASIIKARNDTALHWHFCLLLHIFEDPCEVTLGLLS